MIKKRDQNDTSASIAIYNENTRMLQAEKGKGDSLVLEFRQLQLQIERVMKVV